MAQKMKWFSLYRRAYNQKEPQLAGIYSFSSTLQTEAILSKTLKEVPKLTEIKATDQTNIEQSLQLAAGIIDPKKATRLVLLTDGNETKGDALEFATKLKGSNISVDVRPFSQPVVNDVSLKALYPLRLLMWESSNN